VRSGGETHRTGSDDHDGKLVRAGGGRAAHVLLLRAGGSTSVSHHLRILREAGLVTSEKRGTNVWYAAVPAALEALRAALDSG